MVSIDVNYSETGWYSDVILPESTFLERANLIASKSGLKPSFQMRDQCVAPRFDSRPAWWIFRELAKRLGVGEYFDFEIHRGNLGIPA
jgi:thiosulfate reductase/polysulfide reductase chain A